jgi:chymotrypsin-like protease
MTISFNILYYCRATLIHEDMALSAAHCFTGSTGILYFNSTTRRLGYSVAVDFARLHPNFNHKRDDPDWDYLVLKLLEPVPPSVATPVVLNRDASVPSQLAQALLAVGFGRTVEGGVSDSATLQHVLLPYVPNDMCGQSNYGVDKINSAMLCAGEPGKDACQGDSGGPIFLSDRVTQVGITSW